MRVTVKLFAILRELGGTSQTSIELPSGSTVATAVESLEQQLPSLRPHLKRAAFAVNQDYAARDVLLREGDELALIPPVSGG